MPGKITESRNLQFTTTDQELFSRGEHDTLYRKLGAHLTVQNGQEGAMFAVWAPHAQKVHVTGSFNEWSTERHAMRRMNPAGIWQLFIPGVCPGDSYQFLVTAPDGRILKKSDPFAMQAQLRPRTASVVTKQEAYPWSDQEWIKKRETQNIQKEPLAIYECHIGSWKRNDDPGNSFYDYRTFADEIAAYVKKMHYTHVELMGIAEHPLDESWGYQVTGYYAPTSRYGTPEDFKYLVNTLHENGIGVILDWVPAHFPKDAHGLADFDGLPLFEHPNPKRSEHPHWGTRMFYYDMHEIQSFMLANALYWIREFHVDGLRVDAVASMLYLDFGKESGSWLPNADGGNQNPAAALFLQKVNAQVKKQFPGVWMIAEDSSLWPQVTALQEEGGLGFLGKWNLGWMHDFCAYMGKDQQSRRKDHYDLTFAMSYHEKEHYILPLSHDEVVHGKGSMLRKMEGCRVDQYANLRLGYTYLFGHSGKKLLFMGQDFAQEREWSPDRPLDWELLENEYHKGIQEYVKELLALYGSHPCLYRIDKGWDGFFWVNADDTQRGTYSFIRTAQDGSKKLLFILNMSSEEIKDYAVGVPENRRYALYLNSQEKRFGGSGAAVSDQMPHKKACDGFPYRLEFALPAYAALVFGF